MDKTTLLTALLHHFSSCCHPLSVMFSFIPVLKILKLCVKNNAYVVKKRVYRLLISSDNFVPWVLQKVAQVDCICSVKQFMLFPPI